MSCLFKISHLSKKYKGEDKFVLDDLSFSLPSKGLIGIAGKSGCGKSTLLHLLMGLLKPSSGHIFYRQKDFSTFNQKQWLRFRRNESSIVFQHYNLIEEQSAVFNITLPLLIAGKSRSKAKKRAEELLNQFGLSALSDKKVRVLSGGEKQRIAICRSMAANPSIIFADEPTGALDSKNSELVMQMLSEISKSSTVVLVSHNIDLIERFADRLILLKNGKIEENRIIHPIYDDKPQPMARVPVKDGHWIGRFLKHNLLRHPASVLIRVSSTFIGFMAIILSLGFAFGNGPALEQEKINTLDYCSFRLSSREYVEIPSSPLRLIKQSRPLFDDANDYLLDVEIASIHLDYSFFLPTSLPFDLDGVRQDPARVLPLFDTSLSEHGSGLVLSSFDAMLDEMNSCIVNEQFANAYDASLGQRVHLEYEAPIAYEGSKETIVTTLDFTIGAIVKEFDFLNSPKIYYSYPMIDRYYGERILENFPSKNGRKQTVSSLLRDAPGDLNLTNYGYLVYSHGVVGAERLIDILEKQKDDGILIESDAYNVASSFSSLSSALLTSLALFMVIGGVSLVLIISLNAYSSFLAQKKQSAILMSLGAKRGEIIGLVSMEGILLSSASVAAVIPFSFVGEALISKLLENEFGIPSLIQIPFESLWGIPYALIPLMFIAAVLISLLSSAIPLLIAGRIDLAEALKEE